MNKAILFTIIPALFPAALVLAGGAANSLVAVECDGDIAVGSTCLLSTTVAAGVFDGQLHGRLRRLVLTPAVGAAN
jgi:hypothetical protein